MWPIECCEAEINASQFWVKTPNFVVDFAPLSLGRSVDDRRNTDSRRRRRPPAEFFKGFANTTILIEPPSSSNHHHHRTTIIIEPPSSSNGLERLICTYAGRLEAGIPRSSRSNPPRRGIRRPPSGPRSRTFSRGDRIPRRSQQDPSCLNAC